MDAKDTATSQESNRRRPSQARGKARVDTILDTAEALFSRDGVERVSTNQIASEAGMSVGSIYQFFANKDAILAALVDRYRDARGTMLLESAGDIPSKSVAELVDRMVSTGVGFALKHARFARLMLSATPGSPLAAADLRLQRGMVALIESVIAMRAPSADPALRAVAATMAQVLQRATLIRVLEETAAGNHAFAAQLVEESKRMQRAYFEQLLAQFES